MGKVILFLLAIGVLVFAYFKLRAKFKTISPLGTITLVTGAVKTGKSTLAVHLAIKSYKKALRAWQIGRLLGRKGDKPLLYSNIPLRCEYVPVDTDILLRRKKIVPKSVMFLDEASLVADSQLIKDGVVNNNLLLFFKLYGHMSHGGTLVCDTQSVSDLHYAIKRTLTNYIFVQRTRRLPFFLVMDVLEQRYSDDGTVLSTQNEDIDNNLRHVILSKRVWGMFDCYAYSVFTDDLPTADGTTDGRYTSLKTENIPSFRDWIGLIPQKKDGDK